jgi:hypothetical protein
MASFRKIKGSGTWGEFAKRSQCGPRAPKQPSPAPNRPVFMKRSQREWLDIQRASPRPAVEPMQYDGHDDSAILESTHRRHAAASALGSPGAFHSDFRRFFALNSKSPERIGA